MPSGSVLPKRRPAAVALLISASVVSGFAPAGRPSDQDLGDQVDAFVRPNVTMGDFSGSVLIARRGRILLSRGYGAADVERRRAPDEHTPFGIGSLSKTMTAARVEWLAAQGKLGLDDPISKYLPEFARGDSITVRQLLGHASGLKDYYAWPLYATDRTGPISTAAFLAALESSRWTFDRGPARPTATPGTSSSRPSSSR